MNLEEGKRVFHHLTKSMTPGYFDIRIVVPPDADRRWATNKRLFRVSPVLKPNRHPDEIVTDFHMEPLLGDGEAFVASTEYLEKRTVIVGNHRHSAEYLAEVLSSEDFRWWKIYVERNKHVKFPIKAAWRRAEIEKDARNYDAKNPYVKQRTVADAEWGGGGERRSAIIPYDGQDEMYRILAEDQKEHDRREAAALAAASTPLERQLKDQHVCTDTATQFKFEENTKMNRVTNVVKSDNVDALKVAAQLTAGKTLNGLVQDKAVTFLPKQYQMLAGTPLGVAVIANAINAIVAVYAESNPGETGYKLQALSSAMVTSATVDVVGSFDIDEIVRELLSSSEVSAVMQSVNI